MRTPKWETFLRRRDADRFQHPEWDPGRSESSIKIQQESANPRISVLELSVRQKWKGVGNLEVCSLFSLLLLVICQTIKSKGWKWGAINKQRSNHASQWCPSRSNQIIDILFPGSSVPFDCPSDFQAVKEADVALSASQPLGADELTRVCSGEDPGKGLGRGVPRHRLGLPGGRPRRRMGPGGRMGATCVRFRADPAIPVISRTERTRKEKPRWWF